MAASENDDLSSRPNRCRKRVRHAGIKSHTETCSENDIVVCDEKLPSEDQEKDVRGESDTEQLAHVSDAINHHLKDQNCKNEKCQELLSQAIEAINMRKHGAEILKKSEEEIRQLKKKIRQINKEVGQLREKIAQLEEENNLNDARTVIVMLIWVFYFMCCVVVSVCAFIGNAFL